MYPGNLTFYSWLDSFCPIIFWVFKLWYYVLTDMLCICKVQMQPGINTGSPRRRSRAGLSSYLDACTVLILTLASCQHWFPNPHEGINPDVFSVEDCVLVSECKTKRAVIFLPQCVMAQKTIMWTYQQSQKDHLGVALKWTVRWINPHFTGFTITHTRPSICFSQKQQRRQLMPVNSGAPRSDQ